MNTTAMTTCTDDDRQYEAHLGGLRSRFEAVTASAPRLFTTDAEAEALFDAFLAALPDDRRQHYNCRACRRFVERFGGLVTVAPDGASAPLFWDPSTAQPFFEPAVSAVAHAVSRARVTGVFLCEEATWGLPSNKSAKLPGEWWHMAAVPPAMLVYRPSALKTASQAAAEKLEEHGMICRGLAEFPIDVVRQAHTLLSSEALYRSEKCLGVAKWLLDLHEAIAATKNKAARENMIWLATAAAPVGFAHVRSSMIGTLLEDIASGLPFADVSRKFAEKMHPLQYQRPTALPSAGNIEQAEAIVVKLGIAPSLARRFARIEDVQAIWKPTATKIDAPNGGVFGHLKAKGAPTVPQIEAPPTTMTWEKFARTVLHDAERIEFYVAPQARPYCALVTAVNPDAPPILQWDRLERRNPVSWYLYNGGSSPAQWGLSSGAWVDVTAITLRPSMWDAERPHAHQGEGAILLLAGCKDLRHVRSGGFFPETLKSELHAVRATLEAYAMNAAIADRDEATACGLMLHKGQSWNDVVRVTSKSGRVSYKLDRWD